MKARASIQVKVGCGVKPIYQIVISMDGFIPAFGLAENTAFVKKRPGDGFL